MSVSGGTGAENLGAAPKKCQSEGGAGADKYEGEGLWGGTPPPLPKKNVSLRGAGADQNGREVGRDLPPPKKKKKSQS